LLTLDEPLTNADFAQLALGRPAPRSHEVIGYHTQFGDRTGSQPPRAGAVKLVAA
jgi:hypothetical protein